MAKDRKPRTPKLKAMLPDARIPPERLRLRLKFSDGLEVDVPITEHVEMRAVETDPPTWTYVRTIGMKPSPTDTHADALNSNMIKDHLLAAKDAVLAVVAEKESRKEAPGNDYAAKPSTVRTAVDNELDALLAAQGRGRLSRTAIARTALKRAKAELEKSGAADAVSKLPTLDTVRQDWLPAAMKRLEKR